MKTADADARRLLADECERASQFFGNANVPDLRNLLGRAAAALRPPPPDNEQPMTREQFDDINRRST